MHMFQAVTLQNVNTHAMHRIRIVNLQRHVYNLRVKHGGASIVLRLNSVLIQ